MEGRYNVYGERTTFRNHEEFQEEDIWAVLTEQNESNTVINSFNSSATATRRVPAGARIIPRGSNTINSNQEAQLIQQSAPVNIPDWSKVYGTNSKKKPPLRTVSFHGDDVAIADSWYSDEDVDELDGEMMPPHQWIAKKLARTQISPFSVCEGAGRTLKGRDLSRVRNSVLSRTGFLE